VKSQTNLKAALAQYQVWNQKNEKITLKFQSKLKQPYTRRMKQKTSSQVPSRYRQCTSTFLKL
jgi:hypothetical protein